MCRTLNLHYNIHYIMLSMLQPVSIEHINCWYVLEYGRVSNYICFLFGGSYYISEYNILNNIVTIIYLLIYYYSVCSMSYNIFTIIIIVLLFISVILLFCLYEWYKWTTEPTGLYSSNGNYSWYIIYYVRNNEY